MTYVTLSEVISIMVNQFTMSEERQVIFIYAKYNLYMQNILVKHNKTNLAPRSCKPFSLAWFLGGAILGVFELLFGITVLVRNFFHFIFAENAAEYFARLNAGSAFCRALRNC